MMTDTFKAKLDVFCALLEQERNEDLKQQSSILHTEAIKEGRRGYYHIGYDEGSRFVKVWDETYQGNVNYSSKSVRYFIEKETGIVFGANGWKKYNPARVYGDLDTMHDWDWKGYYAESKKGLNTLVPKVMRR
jgi:hypothetical protein